MLRLVTISALVVCFAWSASAAAQVTATVLGVEGDSLSARELAAISRSVLDGATRVPGWSIDDFTNVNLTDTMLLIGCSGVQAECMDDVAGSLETDRLVFGYVRGSEPAILELTLFDGRAGLAMFTVPLVVDTPQALTDRVAAVLQGLTILRVSGVQHGVARVDGGPPRDLPAEVAVPPGPHRVDVVFDDGRTDRADTVAWATPAFIDVAVQGRGRAPRAARAAAVETPVAASDRHVDGAAIALSSAGIAALTASAVLMARLAETEQAFAETPFQREAHALASTGARQARWTNVSLGAGAGFLVCGVVAALIRSDRPSSPEISVTPGGVRARLSW